MNIEATLRHIETAIEREAQKLESAVVSDLESAVNNVERLLGLHYRVQMVGGSGKATTSDAAPADPAPTADEVQPA